MARKATLYPIHGLANAILGQPLDPNMFPFQVVPNVTIENVTSMLNEQTWAWAQNAVGRREMEQLRRVHYAIVHRYEAPELPHLAEGTNEESKKLIHNCAALLRLIRPMRQGALLMQGNIREDNALDVLHFRNPVDLLEVPEVQKLFQLRDRDAVALRELAPEFMRGMGGEFWKFRMAVEFHEAGHFQDVYWKARYSLWSSALESIFTTQDPEHRGSNAARERIKWFLGETTPIYPLGDIPEFCAQSNLTVADVVGDIYEIRNFISHGDRIPDEYWQRHPRRGFDRDLNVPTVCLEGLSFIVRNSLIKILRDRLLDRFQSAGTAEPFFAAAGLTNDALRHRQRQQ